MESVAKFALVFAGLGTIVGSMGKPWYRQLFHHSQEEADLKSTEEKANRGDADAQFGLGLKYATGPGEEPDYPRAAQWYRKAADQSHALAQFNLGLMYASGQGVTQDDVEALLWILKAANQGDPGAQYNLGVRQHSSSVRGLPKDALEARIEAYKWFQLASAQGYGDSEAASATMTLKMTHEDVLDGERRTAAFVVKAS
jgi:hypothetical protein